MSSPPNNSALAMTIIQPGMRSTLQDHGRSGLKKFGIPASGVMDRRSHDLVNQALGNDRQAATLEILLGNVSMTCERDSWIAIVGAGQAVIDDLTIPFGIAQSIKRGQLLRISYPTDGLWTYLGIASGWSGPSWFGSRSTWPEGSMGQTLKAGDELRCGLSDFSVISQHAAMHNDIPLKKKSIIRLWMGPQWSQFSAQARETLFTSEWAISPRSNRAGYRLLGPTIDCPAIEMISEPALLGSLQITPEGTAIALLNDGPTIGGYPKIALIHDDDLDAFRQLQPGSRFHFLLYSP
jgi:biotin-dependent carboxylase-like uncharacterized protein